MCAESDREVDDWLVAIQLAVQRLGNSGGSGNNAASSSLSSSLSPSSSSVATAAAAAATRVRLEQSGPTRSTPSIPVRGATPATNTSTPTATVARGGAATPNDEVAVLRARVAALEQELARERQLRLDAEARLAAIK